MQRRVVYVLGAGFSAPLGLPVVANFISTARDLHQGDPARFRSFEEVFMILKGLTPAKNSFEVDCRNIEEVLSILEMEPFAGGMSRRDTFEKFLSQVLIAKTPTLRGEPTASGHAAPNPFTEGYGLWRGYATFIANLRRLLIKPDDRPSYRRERVAANAAAHYALLSLNYDGVVEMTSALIDSVTTGEATGLEVVTHTPPRGDGDLVLAKLHGSIHDGSIVPPTWNKASQSKVTAAWAHALKALRSANEIRVLGYSLPETDSYMRYLFKCAAVDAENLQSVDVVCRDDEAQSVERRYRDFVRVRLRFANRFIEDYFKELMVVGVNWRALQPFAFDALEDAHERFMFSSN